MYTCVSMVDVYHLVPLSQSVKGEINAQSFQTMSQLAMAAIIHNSQMLVLRLLQIPFPCCQHTVSVSQ